MKKNKWMRLASVLLVLCLLTTSVVSGTFAKYVTTDSGEDAARIAKFGVVTTVSGDMFGDSYAPTTDDTVQAYNVNADTVAASAQFTAVVAPGTKAKNTMNFSVVGTPEVTTTITFDGALNANGTSKNLAVIEPVLVAGTYGVMVPYTGDVTSDTVGNFFVKSGSGVFTVAADPTADLYELHDGVTTTDPYYPLIWTVTGATNPSQSYTTSEIGAVITNLQTYFGDGSTENHPNVALDKSATIKWAWEFQVGTNDGIYYEYDKQDTILGDMIAAALSGMTGGTVVVSTAANTYATVKYAEVPVATGASNNVWVAYNDSSAPTDAAGASVLAVLGVAFDASITVVQVD